MSATTATLPLSQEVIAGERCESSSLQPSHASEGMHLVAQVERALCSSGYPSLRSVQVALRDQAVVLQGRVFSYYLKQVAQEMALMVPGVGELRNELVVA